MKRALLSALALAVITLVTSCELVAYQDEAGASSGSGSTGSSTSTTSTGTGNSCTKNPSTTCNSECAKFCPLYETACPGTVGAPNNFGSPAACCELCNLLYAASPTLITCREHLPIDCSKDGPFGVTATCGTDQVALYCGICGGSPGPMTGLNDAAVVKAAVDEGIGGGCATEATCNCEYALGASKNPICGMPGCP